MISALRILLIGPSNIVSSPNLFIYIPALNVTSWLLADINKRQNDGSSTTEKQTSGVYDQRVRY